MYGLKYLCGGAKLQMLSQFFEQLNRSVTEKNRTEQ